MPKSITSATGRLSALAGAICAFAIALLIGLATADAAPVRILGQTERTPRPSCPTPQGNNVPSYKHCSAYGQVTGFQRNAGGRRGLYKVPRNGHIVAWSVRLSRKPDKEAFDIFTRFGGTERYGNGPTAGISVIRKVKNKKRKYRLKRRSPIVQLRHYYGKEPIFTLEKPLKVRAGDIVALTTPTWVSNFATKARGANRPLSAQNVWVASRARKNCSIPSNVPPAQRPKWFFDHTSPHMKVGTERGYGCAYSRARILYRAWFVPAGGGQGRVLGAPDG
ncbi:MAG TPA: hypothetical protein VIL04_01275 [Solirubrobacterales bacterium]|jgi:hypothetical protein